MPRNQNNPQAYKPRKANIRENKQRFLIVCQGKETETKYFESFQVFKKIKSKAVSPTQIVELAKKGGIEVAYSNASFELWYILHFEFLNTGISQSDYEKKLTQNLGHKYQKNSDTIYDEILEFQPTAIRNAERLLAQYSPINPEQNNPSTTVHLLVSELNRFIR
jgi:hypothetical protein